MKQRLADFNTRAAIIGVGIVGTMGFFYACVILVTVPLLLPSTMPVVQYISSGYLQLILLPLLMVGAGILGDRAQAAADKRHQEQEAANEARHQEQLDGQNRMIAHLETLMARLCDKEGVSTDDLPGEEKGA